MTNPTAGTPDHTASSGVTATAPSPAPAHIAQTASDPQPGLGTPIRRSSGLLAVAIVGIIVLSVVALLVVVYLIAGLGVGGFALGGIMALVPLAVVFFGVRWIDRWEPEPRAAVLFAFLWGAGVAVLIALIVGAEIDNVINSLGGPGAGYEFFAAAIQAPIVEETGKGLGVLIVFWVARKHFDGPVDGLVYAAWVAGGFAFTENILYFGSELLNPDGTVFQIFLIRGLMSPFAHVMFTACTGLALGFAARRTGALGAIGYFILGLIPAILLHGLWNGALFFVSDFFAYYAIVQFPLFLGAVFLVLYLRRQEAKLTFDRLSEYAAVGWFNPNELPALATVAGRRQAMGWARRNNKGPQMRQLIKDSTALAFARQRIITGRGRAGAEADEAALLAAIVQRRTSVGGIGSGTA